MATLNEQIVLLEEQLKLNQQANEARHILGEYEAIRSPLSKVDSSMRTMFDHYQVLQVLPEDAPEKMVFSEEIKKVAKKALFDLQALTERWKAEGYEVRQGNDLALVTEELKTLVFSCAAEVNQCWQSWTDSLKILVSLEDILLQSQKNIPGLEAIYQAFVKAINRFRELVSEFPQDAETIVELQRLSARMHELKGNMRFDLPDDVASFFKELDNLNRKVSLSVMTSDVFEWLRSHNLLDAYIVSRKGRF